MLRMWPLNIARCLRSSSRNLAGKAPIGDCDVFQAQEQLTALPADCLMHATRRRKTDQAPCIQLSLWAFLRFAWSSLALLCFVQLPTCLLCFALASQGPSKAQRLENPMTGYRGVMAAKTATRRAPHHGSARRSREQQALTSKDIVDACPARVNVFHP